MMDYEGVKSRLDLIRGSSHDMRSQIDAVLKTDDRIGIAVISVDAYAKDLYMLMRDMAQTANPVLREMGLGKEAIEHDIEEFVRILDDNRPNHYFASINLDSKYTRNRYILENVAKWLERLEESVGRVQSFLESDTERVELERLFARVDETGLPLEEKDELKKEFLAALNRLSDKVC